MKSLIYTVFLWSLFIAYSIAGTIHPNISDEKHIEYAEQFNHVVRLTIIDNNNRKMLGSAVVINDHWIITAAHMVQNCKSSIIEYKDNKYCLDFMIYPKEFSEDTLGHFDIALGYSKKPLGVDFDLKLYENDDAVGKVCSIVGFGITGSFNTGATISDSKKRAGSNIIKETFRDLLVCSITDHPPTKLEFLIANGDSGGGLFIDGKLAGINSCVLSDDKNGPNSDYGDESGHTSIVKNLDWIKEIMSMKEIDSNLVPSE